jgi:threonine synthase
MKVSPSGMLLRYMVKFSASVIDSDLPFEGFVEQHFGAGEAEAVWLGRDLETVTVPLHDVVVAVDPKPVKFFGTQATGCSPISTAVKAGNADIEPQRPATIARSLAIGNPADGHYAIKAITNSGGWAEDVSDAEVVESIQLLAETEGIFTETAGGVTVGTARKLYKQGRISPEETTVLCITGNGLKTTDALAGRYAAEEAIVPKISVFDKYLESALDSAIQSRQNAGATVEA